MPRKGLLWGGVLLIAGAAVTPALYEDMRKLEPDDGLVSFLPTVTRADGFASAPGRVIGKILIVGARDNKVSLLQSQLRTDIRASGFSDAGTIVTSDCVLRQVGTYTFGSPAMRWLCTLIFMDKERREIFARERVWGPPPATLKVTSTPGHGAEPTTEIVSLINALPVGRSTQAEAPPRTEPGGN